MTNQLKKLQVLISERLDSLGLSAYQAAVRAKLPQDSIRYVLEGKEPGFSRAFDICKALDIPIDFIASAMPDEDTDLVYIQQLDVSFSAGFGTFMADHPLHIGSRPFSRKWLARKGLKASNLRLIRVLGDSMDPLIKDKDTAMVDLSVNTPVNSIPVAFRLDKQLYVKMAQSRGDGSIEMISINKAYSPIVINAANPPDDFAVVAGVVWHAHSWV